MFTPFARKASTARDMYTVFHNTIAKIRSCKPLALCRRKPFKMEEWRNNRRYVYGDVRTEEKHVL